MERNKESIIRALYRITHEGGDGNFVIISVHEKSSYYVQFIADNGGKDLYGEAVSNEYLRMEEHLSPDRYELLRSLGWEGPDFENSGNFKQEWSASTIDEYVKM